MIKKVFFTAAALILVCGIARAQSDSPAPHSKGFIIDMWTQWGMGDRFQPVEIMLAPGWAFNRTLFGRAQIGGEIALWNIDGKRIWSENITIGPALGVNVWRSKRSDDRLAVVGAFGYAPLEKDAWGYNSYDLGVELADRNVLVGAGVRHYNSQSRDFLPGATDRNRTIFYLKIGWTVGK